MGSVSNRIFVKSLASVILALLLSAALLIAGWLALVVQANENDQLSERGYSGADFIARIGQFTTGPKHAPAVRVLTGLDGDWALLVRSTFFSASEYPLVSIDIQGVHSRLAVYLLWRTRGPSDTPVLRERVYPAQNGPTILAMAGVPGWSGQITEIGLDIYGVLGDEPLVIKRVTIIPPGIGGYLAAVWSRWHAFEGWSQSSINSLGKAHRLRQPAPLVVTTLWAGLAALLVWLIHRLRGAGDLRIALLGAVLLPWMSLDLLWQSEITYNLAQTRAQFAGKTQHERHLAAPEQELYSYAQYLKKLVLPEPGVRVFLLDDSEALLYDKLVLNYYLLPHNLFSEHMGFHPQLYMEPGDYVLLPGDGIDALHAEDGAFYLSWYKGFRLPLALVDQHPLGRLFVVLEGTPE